MRLLTIYFSSILENHNLENNLQNKKLSLNVIFTGGALSFFMRVNKILLPLVQEITQKKREISFSMLIQSLIYRFKCNLKRYILIH